MRLNFLNLKGKWLFKDIQCKCQWKVSMQFISTERTLKYVADKPIIIFCSKWHTLLITVTEHTGAYAENKESKKGDQLTLLKTRQQTIIWPYLKQVKS